MKNYLVKFKCIMGDYEHTDYYIFNKRKSEWGYCKEFWGNKNWGLHDVKTINGITRFCSHNAWSNTCNSYTTRYIWFINGFWWYGFNN